MDNFDLKKYLVENRVTSKHMLNEDEAKVYQMDNINVKITDYPGQSVFMSGDNQKLEVRYNTKEPGDKRMEFKAPSSLRNKTPMYQNIPKLEREIWAAITEEFRKLDERLPSIVQQVIYDYEPTFNEEKINEMATLIKKKLSPGSEKPLQVGDIITWKQAYSTGDNYYGTSYKRMKGKITKILGSANVEAEDFETGDLYKVSRRELTLFSDWEKQPTRKGPDPYASNY